MRFFQLYLPHDRELAISLLERAHKSGYTVCMMTVDTWQLVRPDKFLLFEAERMLMQTLDPYSGLET